MANRARSFTAPPPDPAEALYYEGMAAYQHRNWEQALDRFSRLKELQPTRPGLEALLDEVRWFLQLQATTPVIPGAPEAISAPRPPVASRTASRFRRWQTLGVAVLALVGIVALVLIAFQGRLPWMTPTGREAQDIYNRGQARLSVGDYEGAQAAFKKVLEISPDDPEAQLGLARAERQQTLAQEYAAAEAAIAEEDWDKAAAALSKILADDPGYSDAQAKADFVAQRQRLANLYADGSRLYDLGQWEDAIVQFEKVRELDNSYRTEAVAEFLFVSYLNAGQALIEEEQSDLPDVERAVDLFSRAVAIHPRNRLAADARRLGGLYLDAIRALANGNRADAQTQLTVLLAETPTYGKGKAAEALYTLLLRNAEDAMQAGDFAGAIQDYRQAQTVPVEDKTAAVRGEALALAITPTPTPPPTFTPSPSPAPVPLAVVREGPLTLRSGPGRGYAAVSQLDAGATLTVTGRTGDGTWLRVCCVAATRQQGWLDGALVELHGMLDAVAVVTPAPSASAPAATPRPTLTRPPELICVGGGIYNTAGGTPLAGWTITLKDPTGAVQTQRSASNGAYQFSDLAAGVYTVSLEAQPGWRVVSPQASTVTVTPADACLKVDFWNEGGGSGAPGPTSPPSHPTPTPPR